MAPKGKKGSSKQASKQVSRAGSGAATPVVLEPQTPVDALVGINFGQSFSSVAVINKEGLADCIANDDGERQIASALSFNGEEEYSGVPARIQLVRNSENTILAFRNLLGKSYDEVKSVKQPSNSAPVVNANGEAGFTVSIKGTPTTLTVHQVAVRFLRVLLSYATDFLGRKVTQAVLSVPADFSEKQVEALVAAAKEAGINVIQTIPEAAAALTAYHSTDLSEGGAASSSVIDKNTVVVDVGGSSTTVSVFSVRDGLFAPRSSVTDATLGGDLFDAKLSEWFGKEFTKKTKVPMEASNHRAQMKLRLAVEVTKKSLSASNSAPCSVESLADGMDFHGSVNRTRFDLLASGIYDRVVAKTKEALEQAKVDPLQVQEVILVGGSTRLPKLSEKLEYVFPESTTIQSSIDNDEAIAKGAALQTLSISKVYPTTPSSTSTNAEHQRSLTETTVVSPSFLAHPIGFVVDKTFVSLVPDHSPLPLRRIFDVPVPKGSGATQVLLSLWEGVSEIKVEAPPPKKAKAASGGGVAGFFSRSKPEEDDDEDDEDDEEDVRTAIVNPSKALGDLVVSVDAKPEGKASAPASVRVTVVVSTEGKGSASAVQNKAGAEAVKIEF